MELILLPLLLLAGLFTLMDGGSDDEASGTSGSGDGDDPLEGTGNDQIAGGSGDDLLTLADQSTGWGGEGDDTLTASDEATAYGRAGDDSLTGSDNATIMGGDGDDTLTASGQSAAYGGLGDDSMTGSRRAVMNGGAGDDVMIGADQASLSGGDGNDQLFMDLQRADAVDGDMAHGLPSHMAGGAGADDFVMTGFPLEINRGSPEDEEFMYSGPVVIEDFNPAADSLGLVLAKADLNDLSMSVSYSAATNATTVTLSQLRAIDGDFTNRAIAKIELRGVTEFDPADLRLYSDTDLTPLDLTLLGTAGNDLLSSFGHPSGESVMDGGAGNDNLFLQDGTVLGGAGNDTIDGQGTLVGGAGDDFLYVHTDLSRSINHAEFLMKGQADGGDGNDTISAQTNVTIGDSWSATGPLVVLGGAGDDYIVASDIYQIDAGSGNDIVIISNDAANGNEAVELGDGRDVVAAEAGEYVSRATIADFDPTEDRLAVIAEPGSATPVVTFTWDAVRGGTIVGEEDVFEFFVAGVNHQTTPITVSYYASTAALQAGAAYATA